MRLRVLFTPVTAIMPDTEETRILAMVTGRRQEVETRGAVEPDGFDDLQLRRENDTWIAAVGCGGTPTRYPEL